MKTENLAELIDDIESGMARRKSLDSQIDDANKSVHSLLAAGLMDKMREAQDRYIALKKELMAVRPGFWRLEEVLTAAGYDYESMLGDEMLAAARAIRDA